MLDAATFDQECFQTTDGEIALINLNSVRRRAWSRFDENPQGSGHPESVLEAEQLTAQFAGDVTALDRLSALADHLARLDASPRTMLVRAHVASMLHRFSDARAYLDQASRSGAPSPDVERLSLNVDQACGTDLDSVLRQRRASAMSGRLEDLVTLGALLADLSEFDDADLTYRQALRQYRDVSPFPVAWVCFQLGVLWGELVVEPELARAEYWYRKAVGCLPCYVKARVHLAEILAGDGRTRDAEETLLPAIASGDPEVTWRLADVLAAAGRHAEAGEALELARSGFEALLEKHLLAFADHGAEFYSGSGNNARRSLELAQINLANRPTLRAFEQAYEMAINAADIDAAIDIRARASERWGGTTAFRLSSLEAGLEGAPV